MKTRPRLILFTCCIFLILFGQFFFIHDRNFSEYSRDNLERVTNFTIHQLRTLHDTDIRGRELQFGCHNIDEIKLIRAVGYGINKAGYLGMHNGTQVAVRMTTKNMNTGKDCIGKEPASGHHFIKTKECWTLGQIRIMHEILVLQQLSHPAVTKLLGFCIRSYETTDMSLLEHGAIIVTEFAQALNEEMVNKWSLRECLQRTLEMVDLFLYFEKSPLGSVEFPDVKIGHFGISENRLIAIDYDDANTIEPLCPKEKECIFGLPCSDGRCKGYNAKLNMIRFDFLSKYFLPVERFPEVTELKTIRKKLKDQVMTAQELNSIVHELLRKY